MNVEQCVAASTVDQKLHLYIIVGHHDFVAFSAHSHMFRLH